MKISKFVSSVNFFSKIYENGILYDNNKVHTAIII